jgi:CheY-like chemotaxis protein
VGSRFHFTAFLPVVASSSGQRQEAAQDHAKIEPSRSLQILVAEDNTVNQKILEVKLTRAGHKVLLAADGRAAVDAWRGGTFDLVLMDVQMPELDGMDATRKIRELELELGRERTFIVALTAHAMKSDLDRCLAAGMDAYLGKPIDWDAMELLLAKKYSSER